MIIWGSKPRRMEGRSGTFFCPTCKDFQPYTTVTWEKYFTLYFIPLFSMETLSSVVQCQSCAEEFLPVVLRHTKEQILSAVSPWECRSCQNKNGPGSSTCLGCGQARPAQLQTTAVND